MTIFLYALLTDRAFLYDWSPPPMTPEDKAKYEPWCGTVKTYKQQVPLWSALRSDFIDWRYKSDPPGSNEDTLLMDYVCDKGTGEYKELFAKGVSIRGVHAYTAYTHWHTL